jgi:geranylgeranyl diphosphate synthase type II
MPDSIKPVTKPDSGSERDASHPDSRFDLHAYMAPRKELVDRELERALRPRYPQKLYESMRYSILPGGKRLRSILCLAANDLGGGDQCAAIPTACALEMLHTASLIHDDLPVMDDDDYRRGRLANHKVFGGGIALLAGDAFLSYALEFILEETENIPADRLIQVMGVVLRMIGVQGLVGGQVVDIESENRLDVDLATLEYIHSRKTGAMIDAAVVTGAILAGAGEGLVARLSRYAQKVGLAFQIVDDILDVIGSRQELGKTPHKDEAAHKASFPGLMGIDESRRRAWGLVESAKQELLPLGSRATPLLAIADFVCQRSK